MSDLTQEWCERVCAAVASGTALQLRGGGTKQFYGRGVAGEAFDTRGHAGVVSYEPTELVVTVRAGTPLAELEALLAERNQFLAFEPPHFASGGTVGGCVAAGLSGPRRQSTGALRDFVLGARIIDGRGEVLSFGGQVMKNVAGYDISRVIAGSMGTLGVILDVSLKVLPRPVAESTLRFALDEKEAIVRLNDWGGQPLPVSASAWCGGALHVRLSGAEAAVRSAERKLGGEIVPIGEAESFWQGVRDQRDNFFAAAAAQGGVLWRVSVPTSAAALGLLGRQFIEWGGALRWLHCDAAVETVRARAATLGGHATAFRAAECIDEVFHPLAAPLMVVHRRMKQAFDPAGIFNPGRLYNGL